MACDFLTDRGHRILDRNWRTSHLEIDIVSEDLDGIHFTEVKTRTSALIGPEENVGFLKQRRITSAALKYLSKNKLDGKEVFFDIISVIFEGQQVKLSYFPSAWIPMYTYNH